MPRKLIIDCDPGVDDAVALLWAFKAHKAFDILGITTVAGNVNATLTARNALVLREIAKREDVPVYAGAERPIMASYTHADHFHGTSGLGDLVFDAPKGALATGRSAQFLVDTLRAAPASSIALAVTGPMTNVALALLLEPSIGSALSEIVVMGGAKSEGGNITASAEYNIYADPHAAAIVFGAGLPVVAIGLDVTHQIRTNPARMKALAALKSVEARTVVELLAFSEKVERELAGHEGAPLHDPATIAYLIEPSLFETAPAKIGVETASPLTFGHTAVETRLAAGDPTNVRWATGVDADAVFAAMERDLA